MKINRIYIVLIFIASLIVITHFSGFRSSINLDYIKSIFEENMPVSVFGFIFIFTVANLIQIPGWPFLAAAVITIGTLPGYLLTLIAALVSTIVGFILIRFIGKDSLRSIEWPWIKNLILKTHASPIRYTIFLRIIFQTAPPINYALALSGISFKNYFIGSILGLPIPIFIYTFFIEELAKLTF